MWIIGSKVVGIVMIVIGVFMFLLMFFIFVDVNGVGYFKCIYVFKELFEGWILVLSGEKGL